MIGLTANAGDNFKIGRQYPLHPVLLDRVGIKKPTQKNPPKKTHPKKPTQKKQKKPPKKPHLKNPQKMVFWFFFWVFLNF
jgi:hypothetical protein